ncbi:MAG: hypothetical protein RR784_04140 [Burkholderiaceae bacterium]
MKPSKTILAIPFTLSLALAFGTANATPATAQALPPGHPPITATPAKIDLTGIQKAKGGKTIQEVVAAGSALNGKKVVVRGRVVKVNTGIMGKNWLHIADGSSGGNADLTVTTNANAKLGDLVVATGTIATNKDFGGGYHYAVIMENAALKAE